MKNKTFEFELDQKQLEAVNGGIICGGACVLAAVVAGAGLFGTGVTIGTAFPK
ncbi:MAG: class IIb bacteriocin, lactobin A/cerein 7B family [Pseudobacteriovorax sp.]|nr:class IIb bacteriocin, lactobin A/cerein 7B family [Pseudobacteriovorax sp.]